MKNMIFTEEQTTEEFVEDEQTARLLLAEAQSSVQREVLVTSQLKRQVQQVTTSREQVFSEEGVQMQVIEAPKQEVTVGQEVSQLQQVSSEQPMLLMKESQFTISQQSENLETMTESLVQHQASFSQQESSMNKSIIQQTEVQKSPTVVRKVKKIIKKPKKLTKETVEVATIDDDVSEEKTVEEKPTESLVEEIIQPDEEEIMTVTEIVQRPQTYHEESTIERLMTDVKEEEHVEVKPTKIIKKKVIKKIVKKPVTGEKVEIRQEVDEQKILEIEKTRKSGMFHN